MLALSSLGAVLRALGTAHRIDVEAYTLHGPVLRAVEAAARRGADVNVALDGEPYNDSKRHLASENQRLVDELRASGADAVLQRALHAKTIAADATLYLDGKNWHGDDLILSESAAQSHSVAMVKHEALEEERKLIAGAQKSDGVIVESESFGCCNAVYAALERLARAGGAPRLLVSERELHGNERERRALGRLVAEGARVRVCRDSEKLAAAGDGAWLGSANATLAAPAEDSIDWGLRTRDKTIVAAVRQRLEGQWASARPLNVA